MAPVSRPSITTSTIDPEKADLPYLIRRHGNAAATSWVEQRYSIWRSPNSTRDRPRVQGYIKANHFYVAWGNPVSTKEDLASVAEEFVRHVQQKHKKVVFMNIDATLEKILASDMAGVHWNTISCIREDVIHPSHVELTRKDVRKNRLSAWRAGVRIDELVIKGPTFLPKPEVKQEIEQGLESWLEGRKGTQIASSALLPWVDSRNRRYFVAKGPKGIVGICILAPIGDHRYQIKNSIVFPHAPKGTSEDLLGTVIEQMQDEHRTALTFGTSAAPDITFEHFISRLPTKFLQRSYRYIIEKYHLAERGQFRNKFELEPEPLFVSYPMHGFGPIGVLSLMRKLRT
ncbi:hypothetical protein T439DRAFT_323075 [Meredithblackwellia eburnea MCA 4105]